MLTATYLTTYISIKMTIEHRSGLWEATKDLFESLRKKRTQNPLRICKDKAITLQV